MKYKIYETGKNINLSSTEKSKLLRVVGKEIGRSHVYKAPFYCGKLTEEGKILIKIDQFAPSSKTCSCCGSKQDMPLNVRTYKCDNCGVEIAGMMIDTDYYIKMANKSRLHNCKLVEPNQIEQFIEESMQYGYV